MSSALTIEALVRSIQVAGIVYDVDISLPGPAATFAAGSTVLHGDGTVSAPSISFSADTNTGLYRPGADILAVATGGSERLRIDASGNVGIGTTGPSKRLHVAAADVNGGIGVFENTLGTQYATAGVILKNGATSAGKHAMLGTYVRDADGSDSVFVINRMNNDANLTFDATLAVYDLTNNHWAFYTSGTERLRITSAGDVGINCTPAIESGVGPFLVGESVSAYGPQWAMRNLTNDATAPYFMFEKKRVSAIVQSNDALGNIQGRAWDGLQYRAAAQIQFAVDGTPGSGDMPGRITFSTTADGAASFTERMRIDQAGRVGISRTPATARLEIQEVGNEQIRLYNAAGTVKAFIGTIGIDGSAGTDDLRIRSESNVWFSISGSPVGILNGTGLSLGMTAGATERLHVAGAIRIDTATTGKQLITFWNGAAGFLGSVGTDQAVRGSGSATDLALRGDTSRGIRFFTNGANERMFLDSSGNLGIGVTSMSAPLHVAGTIRAERIGTPTQYVELYSSGGSGIVRAINTPLELRSGASGALALTLDNSANGLFTGTLGVGNANGGGRFWVQGADSTLNQSVWSESGTSYNQFTLRRSRGTQASPTIVSSGDTLGYIVHKGYDGAGWIDSAAMSFEVDGTPGTNDMPGRIIWLTTQDGASSLTERMRLTNSGYLGIGVNPAGGTGLVQIAASTTSRASLNLAAGTAPTSPVDGDIWYDGTHFYGRVAGVTKQLDN